ncbi:MAG TPA: hypothetical protein VM077_05930 [Candidatus Limnocylindrales bacterium]|nr:hypothetical protein [Candidatus Limnocylindrales bacterium]
MIKRIILSLLIIAGVSGSAVMGTQALLSDTAALTSNTFSTGTVDLRVSKTGSTFSTVSTAGYTSGVRPGQTKFFDVYLRNVTTDVALSLSGQATDITVTDITKDQVVVSFTPVNTDGSAIVGAPIATATLAQWETLLPYGYPAEYNLAQSGTQRYKMGITMNSGITVDGSAVFNFVFTGTEVVPAQ